MLEQLERAPACNRVPMTIFDKRHNLRWTARYVYCCLCSFADSAGRCWPSHAAIAARCGITSRSVLTCLHELKAAGLVEVKRHPSEGLPNDYRITDW